MGSLDPNARKDLGVLVPGTRILKAVAVLDESVVPGLADAIFDSTNSVAIRKGREESILYAANGQNVYTLDWPLGTKQRSPACLNVVLCFFGDSEWEVLDRLGVAEVMLG